MSGRFVVDITPLKEHRDFRFLWSGQLVSTIGVQLAVVAVPLQVFDLTGSSLMVGLVSLSQLGPLILGSMIGGVVADAADRRRTMLISQAAMGVCAAALALNAMAGTPRLWPLFVFSGISAAVTGIDSPTRRATVAGLVPRRQLPAALALNSTLQETAAVVGPALAGVLISVLGVSPVFWLNTATFIGAVLTVQRMRPQPHRGGGTPPGIRSMVEGVRYMKGQQAIQGALLIDVNAMVFGMPRALFPALGTDVFGGGATTVGLLYAAPSAGALTGALTTGWVSSVSRHGRAVVVAVAAWGVAIAAFGIVRWLPLALLLLAIAGGADVVSAVFRGTILQMAVPDRLRGRLSSINIIVVQGGPRLGDARAGAMASLVGPATSVVAGGVACVAGAWLLTRLMPALPRWTMADATDESNEP